MDSNAAHDSNFEDARDAELNDTETNYSESNHLEAEPQLGQEPTAASQLMLDASEPFVGRWTQLISRTNWEKGRIIAEWREGLIAAGAGPSDYADEAWSRLVGQVTAQHVGRLRRTYTRFGAVYETYSGLYWTHFLAALEWNDAETWLEGAVQSDWSVNDMRAQRWEALGGPDKMKPAAGEITATEVDEDAPAIPTYREASGQSAEVRDPSHFDADAQSSPRHEGPDFGDEPAASRVGDVDDSHHDDASDEEYAAAAEAPSLERPFEKLPDLPGDFREAFEAYKLAILHHKMKEWSEVSPEDVVGSLRALERLAMAPS